MVYADNPQSYACDISLFGNRRGSGESIWEIKKHIGYVSPEMHRSYARHYPVIDIVASGLHDTIGLYKKIHDDERERCIVWLKIFGLEHIKDYDFFTSNNITKDWMYDFLNLKKKTSDILKVGKYIKCGDICDTLDELNTKRLYGIKPRGDIGSGEYLIRLLFSLVDEVSDPIPFANGKVCGDMVFRDKVYEMKGQWGRLDGVDNNKIAEIIRQHEELNVRKQVTVGSKTNKELVKDLLRCYFNGDNPYTIINVDTHGYVIIDETLEWDDDIDVRVRIPKWMIEKTFNKEIKDGG